MKLSDAIDSPDLIIFPAKDSFIGLISRYLVSSPNLTADEDDFMSSLSAFLYEASSAFIIELSKNQFEPILHRFVKQPTTRHIEKYIPRFLEKTANLLKLVSSHLNFQNLQDYIEQQENNLIGQEAFYARLSNSVPKKIKRNKGTYYLTLDYGKNRDKSYEKINPVILINSFFTNFTSFL